MENTPDRWYKNLPVLTRIGLTTFFVFTVLVQLEILNPQLIALNWELVINKLQIWRLLTSVCFFGKFSFGFMFQLYFFSAYSSKLEQNEIFAQPGDYFFFLFTVIIFLDAISLILAWPTGMPSLGPSLVFAIIYYWSRREPYAQLSFFSFTIKGYQFPFALMFFQMLIGGSVWGDLIGLAAGHLYYFVKDVVPQEYGRTLMKTPQFLNDFMAKYQAAPPAQAAQGNYFGGGGGGGRGGGGGGGGAPPPPAPAAPRNFGGQGHRLGGT